MLMEAHPFSGVRKCAACVYESCITPIDSGNLFGIILILGKSILSSKVLVRHFPSSLQLKVHCVPRPLPTHLTTCTVLSFCKAVSSWCLVLLYLSYA